jgi:hypothetical protein
LNSNGINDRVWQLPSRPILKLALLVEWEVPRCAAIRRYLQRFSNGCSPKARGQVAFSQEKATSLDVGKGT